VIAAFLLACVPAAQQPEAPPAIHSVCDLSQEFSFYMDGRFHSQYLKEVGRDARNWGSLHRLDLANVNLLILTAGDAHVPYSAESLAHVEEFVRGGCAVLLMADGNEPMPPGVALAARFGAKLTTTRAQSPLAATRSLAGLEDGAEIVFRGGTALELGAGWQTRIHDADGRPVLACRALEKGWILIGSRGLFGQSPDASDPINASWITPLLVNCAAAKHVDPKQPHSSTWAEHARAVGPLTLEYHDGTARFADRIAEEFALVRPHLAEITGVEPVDGMIQRLLILPTGGGGFSSGERIAIGAWWGGYPEQRYPMVELLAHEAGHSWVLPHPEPLWNEPIATYMGILTGRRLGMPEAQRTLEQQIAAGRHHDPDFDRLDPFAADAPRDLVWGKSFFIFEELERRHGPGAFAKYFRAKRACVAADRAAYTMDDCVAVWSRAVATDLFPWFRSLAFDVNAARTELAPR